MTDQVNNLAQRLRDELAKHGIRAEVEIIDAGALAQQQRPVVETVCTLPHSPCPVCQAEICFGPKNEAGKEGVCPKCASFLTSDDPKVTPRAIRLMTEDEILELPDSLRIALQRARALVESQQPYRPTNPTR